MSRSSRVIFTIGHSDHTVERFINLLVNAGVTAVADVRSVPFSRRVPHFNWPQLKPVLRSAGIPYAFLGDELGARTKDPNCYVEGRADYDRIAASRSFERGLCRIEKGARRYGIALMCAEREPLDCHRTILVARHLQARGCEIRHILSDGRIERHADTERRLLDLYQADTPNLFGAKQPAIERLSEAYFRRGRDIAFAGRPPGLPKEERLSA
jgi:uncharacterized protein (DUF488 family)